MGGRSGYPDRSDADLLEHGFARPTIFAFTSTPCHPPVPAHVTTGTALLDHARGAERDRRSQYPIKEVAGPIARNGRMSVGWWTSEVLGRPRDTMGIGFGAGNVSRIGPPLWFKAYLRALVHTCPSTSPHAASEADVSRCCNNLAPHVSVLRTKLQFTRRQLARIPKILSGQPAAGRASGPVHALVAKARTTVRSGRRLTRFRVAHFDAGHKWPKLKARLHIKQAMSAKV